MDVITAAREIAADAMRERRQDARHTLTDFDVETFGLDARVQLRLPLRDRVELRHHLQVLARAVSSLLAREDKWQGSEREFILLTKAVMKDTNNSINNLKRVTSRKSPARSSGRDEF